MNKNKLPVVKMTLALDGDVIKRKFNGVLVIGTNANKDGSMEIETHGNITLPVGKKLLEEAIKDAPADKTPAKDEPH